MLSRTLTVHEEREREGVEVGATPLSETRSRCPVSSPPEPPEPPALEPPALEPPALEPPDIMTEPPEPEPPEPEPPEPEPPGSSSTTQYFPTRTVPSPQIAPSPSLGSAHPTTRAAAIRLLVASQMTVV